MNVFSQHAPKEIFDSLDVVADIDNAWLQHLLRLNARSGASSSSSFRGLGNIPRHLGNLGLPSARSASISAYPTITPSTL